MEEKINTGLKIIAFIGESGAGKDSIVKEFLRITGDTCHEVVNYTSRSKRDYEIQGELYFFVTKDEVKENCFEWADYEHGLYGTGIESFNRDKVNLWVATPERILALRKRIRDAAISVVYVMADPKIRLIRQLSREEKPDIEEIIERYTRREALSYNGFQSTEDRVAYVKQVFNPLSIFVWTQPNNTEADLPTWSNIMVRILLGDESVAKEEG